MAPSPIFGLLVALLVVSPTAGVCEGAAREASNIGAASFERDADPVVQTRKPVRKPTRKPAAKPAAKPVPPVTEPADMTCPNVLGTGVTTKRLYCDVLTGLNPAEGILLRLPPRTGTLVLTFDLHNRHLYSASEVKARTAFRSYTATIGVLTMDGQVATRGVVQSEFRTEKDLLDRIADASSATGVKAVGPIGLETVRLEVPEGVNELTILGEKLSVMSLKGTNLFTQPGRPIAAISNVMVEYRPVKGKTGTGAGK